MRIPVPDTSLVVDESGCGRPIVLVHGGTGTGAFDWASIHGELAMRFRTIRLDLRGHGGSPAPGWRLGIVRYGLDVQHVMRALGIPRAMLIGFSAGANSLLTMAMRRPELVSGLVTIGASISSDASRVNEIMAGPWPRDLRLLEHAVSRSPDHWRELRAALAIDWAANNTFTSEDLARVRCPALVVHGADDRIVDPRQAEALVASLPAGELWMAPDAGHMVQRDASKDFVDRVVGFARSIHWA